MGPSGRPGGGQHILSPEEVERGARLRSEHARARFEGSRVAVRRVLAGYLGCGAGDVRFEVGAAGKPSLADMGDLDGSLRFNLSHSGDAALCAVTDAGEVGADIEVLRPLGNVDRLAARHFSGEEFTHWQAFGPAERLAAFYQTWTRKEALLKAAGLGLSRPLERVDTIGATLDEVGYWLRDVSVPNSFRGAVACTERPEGLECWRWEESLD